MKTKPRKASERRSDPQTVSVLIDRSQYVPHLLNVLNNKVSSGASDLYIKRFGIGINDWRVLSVVAREPGCISSFAAEKMGAHKAIVSRALQFLVEHKFVRIEPHGKEKLAFLTVEGKRLYEAVVKVALQRENLLLRGLSEEQKAMLRTLLAHLMDNVQGVNDFFADEERVSDTGQSNARHANSMH